MGEINKIFLQKSFDKAIRNYRLATKNIGLWKSEEYIFDKYFKKDKKIIDIGCGTGRTTFELYEKGYKDIMGIDLSPKMIEEAKQIKSEINADIDFIIGDATHLPFDKNKFDYALFSFNGMMQIPRRKNRIKAMQEIRRVLKKDGIFIFTTHDRAKDEKYFKLWEKEREIWDVGKQDKRLYDFGDKILQSDTEGRELFLHFPTREEIVNYIKESGFKLVEDFYRPELFKENEQVKEFSSECRFWVVKK